MENLAIKGYKGFDDQLQGEGGMQFAVGQTYTNEQGFYFATEAKVITPYQGRYCIVEGENLIGQNGVCVCGSNQTVGSVVVVKTLKIIKEISYMEMAKLVSESVYSKEVIGDYAMANSTTERTTVISNGLKSVAYHSGYKSLAIGIGDYTTVIGEGGYLSTIIAEGNNANIISRDGGVVKLAGDNGNVFIKGSGCVATIEGKDCIVRLLANGIVRGTSGTKIIYPSVNSTVGVYTISNENMAHYVYHESYPDGKYTVKEIVYDVNALHKKHMRYLTSIHNAIHNAI